MAWSSRLYLTGSCFAAERSICGRYPYHPAATERRVGRRLRLAVQGRITGQVELNASDPDSASKVGRSSEPALNWRLREVNGRRSAHLAQAWRVAPSGSSMRCTRSLRTAVVREVVVYWFQPGSPVVMKRSRLRWHTSTAARDGEGPRRGEYAGTSTVSKTNGISAVWQDPRSPLADRGIASKQYPQRRHCLTASTDGYHLRLEALNMANAGPEP
jgi:hypothetical protein